MNRMRASAIALALFAVAPPQLLPSAGAQSITITSASSPAKGQAYGTGSYDLKGTTLDYVLVNAFDQKGIFVASGKASADKLIWAGVVINLTPGQTYQIGATMVSISGAMIITSEVPAADRINVKVQ